MLEALINQLHGDLESALRASVDDPLRGELVGQLVWDARALLIYISLVGESRLKADRVVYARKLVRMAANLISGRRAGGAPYERPREVSTTLVETKSSGVTRPLQRMLGSLPDDVTALVLSFACGAVRINGTQVAGDVVTTNQIRLTTRRLKAFVDKEFPVHRQGFRSAVTGLSLIPKAVMTRLVASDSRAFELSARQILKACPPSEFIYLGVGASPVPCLAELNRQAPDATIINMPLSNIKEDNFSLLLGTVQDNKEARQALFAYLQQFISPKVVGAKRVLLIDFVDKGFSLRLLRYCLCAYFTAHGCLGKWSADERVVVFALASKENLGKVVSKEVPKEMLRSLSFSEKDDPERLLKSLMQALWLEIFKKRNYVLFGKVDIAKVLGGEISVAPTPNFGAYQRLLKHLLDPLPDDDE